MTSFGLIFLIVLGACVVERRLFPYVLCFTGLFPATTIVSKGSATITPFSALGVCSVIALTLGIESRVRGTRIPGGASLAIFAWWALLLTLAAPELFAGIPVFSSFVPADAQIGELANLVFGAQQTNQMVNLILEISVFWWIARQWPPRKAERAIRFTFYFGAILVAWNQASTVIGGVRWPANFFHNSNTRAYVVSNNGLPRVTGSFPEPSLLAGFLVAGLLYFCVLFVQSRKVSDGGLVIVFGFFLVTVGTATSAIALGVILALALIFFAVRILIGHSVSITATLTILLISAVAIVEKQILLTPLIHQIVSKSQTASLSVRTDADLYSLHLLRATYGLGVGLGSDRPLSFLGTLLSCVGVIGTVLFVVFVAQVVRYSLRVPGLIPCAYALIGLLIAKVVADPDLTTPLMWILLAQLATAPSQLAGTNEQDSMRDLVPVLSPDKGRFLYS